MHTSCIFTRNKVSKLERLSRTDRDFSLSELTLYEEVKQRARKLRGREENGQNSTATVNFTIPNINFLLSEKEENLLSCSLLDR